jgi:16S rRNA (guanine527-N7)-methyltransferase
MKTATIARLLEPFLGSSSEPSLDLSQLDQISTYIDLLLRWNARINLTAIRNEDEIVTRHFGESFFMARHLFSSRRPADPSRAPIQVLDIGSGAGFPALPLKIWAPQIQLTLIESNHKKGTFLREVCRALTLTDINVITERAEIAAKNPDLPRAQAVTLRAVERFETILPQAAAFLAPQATLALLIGASQLPHLSTVATLDWDEPIYIPESQRRVLAFGRNSKVD